MSFVYMIIVILLTCVLLFVSYKMYEYIQKHYSKSVIPCLKSYNPKYAKLFYKTCIDANGKTIVTKESYDKAIDLIRENCTNKKVLINCIYYNDIYYAYMDFESLSAFCRLQRNDFLGYSVYEKGNECFVVTFRKQN